MICDEHPLRCVIAIIIISIGISILFQYLYDTRSNKCMVSISDAISSRPEMVELRARCVAGTENR